MSAMILDAQNAALSVQCSFKETLAARWQIVLVTVGQIVGLSFVGTIVSQCITMGKRPPRRLVQPQQCDSSEPQDLCQLQHNRAKRRPGIHDLHDIKHCHRGSVLGETQRQTDLQRLHGWQPALRRSSPTVLADLPSPAVESKSLGGSTSGSIANVRTLVLTAIRDADPPQMRDHQHGDQPTEQPHSSGKQGAETTNGALVEFSSPKANNTLVESEEYHSGMATQPLLDRDNNTETVEAVSTPETGDRQYSDELTEQPGLSQGHDAEIT
ncbi:hypothetical protein K440DRAFT_664386 [Wilcoxina mikolae CBS 423.85]|nr:hypothetical protein K440DRAFT_664386 [Wilcoxina mikolae CBS 423.85]